MARARSTALCAATLVDVVAARASTLQLDRVVMQVLEPLLAINLPPDPPPPRLPEYWPEPPPLPVEPPVEPIEPPPHDPEPPEEIESSARARLVEPQLEPIVRRTQARIERA